VEPGNRLLGNRYELLLPLASGGMGRVWRARDTLLERPVAVKVLRSEFTGDPTFRARFRAEAQHTAALHHPNIASVFDYGEVQEDGETSAYLVMELVEGETLSTLLERVRRLDAGRTLDIVRQTASALAAAHAAGVVHRDVKPGNVLVGSDGVVKITDFGIAWSASSVPLTRTGQVIGTAHYLSPEQAAGGTATPASDVYALGAVAYECLSGRRAFDGESSVQIALKQIRDEPAPLPADVPAGVRRLVEQAMAKDPATRFPDGSALRAAVDGVAAGSPTEPIVAPGRTGTAVLHLPLPVAAPAAAPVASSGRRVPRPPLPAVLGALAALLAVVLVGLLVTRDPGDTPGSSAPTGSTATTAEAATSAAPTPSTVSVIPADLVGRPVGEVQAELVAAQLQVQLVAVETAEAAPGQVTDVAPGGELAVGTPVALSYAVPPPPSERGRGNGSDNGGNGKGNGGHGNGDGGDDD